MKRHWQLTALWLGVASVIAAVAAQVRDWNAMTDELGYERLALSIVQLHTLVPHTHGAFVRSLAQLYPALISPFFTGGYVPTDIRLVHAFNGFLMTSACIPAFLLAERATGRRVVAYAVGFLTACTPWIVYTTVLLTENAGYPAFLWAMLGIHAAISSPRPRNDVLALLGLVLAFFARTQFLLLAAVLPIALVLFVVTDPAPRGIAERVRTVFREHAVLVSVYIPAAIAAIAYQAAGGRLLFLSNYGGQASHDILPAGTAGASTGHLADLAFGLGILPLLVGGAWLLANAFRSRAAAPTRAFACVGAVTAAVLVPMIAAWDLKIGNFVLDRYLYYLGPLFVLATFCALLDRRRPQLSLAVPVVLVVLGFLHHLQGDFLWARQFPLSTDSPIAWLYGAIDAVAGSEHATSIVLAVATVSFAALFVATDRLASRRALSLGVATAMLIWFPVDTALTYAKLFSRNGHASRPLTRSEDGTLDWLDHVVGTGASVTEIPYAVSSAFLVTQQYWRDLEFWNKSIRYGVHYPTDNTYRDAYIWFPPNPIRIDPRTGAVTPSRTSYVVQAVTDTRFRISGTVQRQDPDAMLIDATLPWRVDWLTSGLYDDGWTEPRTTALVRVYPARGQAAARMRTLSLQVRLPDGVERGSFTVRTNAAQTSKKLANGVTAFVQAPICVPPRGFAVARLATPVVAAIPGDQQSHDASLVPRRGGVLVADLSLADEIGGPCRSSAAVNPR